MTESPQWSVIEPGSCQSLLAAARVGRLAVIADGRPMIVVLNFIPFGADLLFRTADDTRLARLITAETRQPAEFEVSSASAAERSGWSVIAHGDLLRERDPGNLSRALAEIRPWAGGRRDVVLRLQVTSLTGLRAGAAG